MSLFDKFSQGISLTTEKKPEQEGGFIKKAARFVLPKSVEYAIGLTPRPEEISAEKTGTLYEQFQKKQSTFIPKTVEDYTNVLNTPVFQEREVPEFIRNLPPEIQEKVMRSGTISEYKGELKEPTVKERIESMEYAYITKPRQDKFKTIFEEESKKNPTVKNEAYKEPTGFWGQFVEGLKFGIEQAKPVPGYFTETMGAGVSPEWVKWGQEFGDRQTAKLITQKSDLFRPEKFGSTRAWVGRVIGEQLPIWGTMLACATLGGLMGGPAGAAVGSYGSVYTLEQANAYKQMMDRGIAPDKAQDASKVYGIISSAIENAFGYSPSKIGAEVVKEGFKKFTISELPKIGKEMLKKSLEEGEEEAAQQLTQNLITKFYDRSQGVWEGVAQSFIEATIGSIPAGGTEFIPYVKGIGKKVPIKETTPKPSGETQLVDTKTGEIIKPEGFQDTYLKTSLGPAEYAARVIERKLTGEERLRQGPKGRELLAEQLAKEEKITKIEAEETKLEQQASEIVEFLLGNKKIEPEAAKEKVAEIIKPSEIYSELEPLAQEARKFGSAREWQQAIAEAPVKAQEEITQKLIRAGFIEKSPIPSKKVLPSLTDFYNQAVRGAKKKAEVPKGSEWKERGFITSVKEAKPVFELTAQERKKETVESLTEEIDKKIEKFREVADLMAPTEGAGVRYRRVEDAVGEFNFLASDFKKSRAGYDMKERAEDFKNYANQLLYENDENYRNLVDRRDKLLETKIEDSTDEIEIRDIFDEISKEESKINEADEKLSAAPEIERIEAKGAKEAGGTAKERDIYEKYGNRNLIESWKPIEERAIKYVSENEKAILDNLNTGKYANYLSGDLIKTFIPEYNKDRTKYDAFKAAANYIWNKRFDELLINNKNLGNGKFSILMGGPGSGKTTSVEKSLGTGYLENYAIVMETLGSDPNILDMTIKKILDNGYKIDVYQIVSDVKDAYERVLIRAMENERKNDGKGRTIFIDNFVDGHFGAKESGAEFLAGKYADNEKISYNLFDNRIKGADPSKIESGEKAFDIINKISYNGITDRQIIKNKLYELTKQKFQRGEISRNVYEGQIGFGEAKEVNLARAGKGVVRRVEKGGKEARRVSVLETEGTKIKPSIEEEGGFILHEGKKVPIVGTMESATGKITFNEKEKLEGLGYTPEEVKEFSDMTEKGEFGPVAPKIYKSVKEAKTDMTKNGQKSVYDQPLTQLDYVFYKFSKNEQIPKELNSLAVKLVEDGMLERVEPGAGVKVDMTGMFFKTAENVEESDIFDYKLNTDEEEIGLSVESLKEFYHIDEVAKVENWKDLQSGWGIDKSGLEKGDVVKSNDITRIKTNRKGEKETLAGYGIIEDIFDDGRALVYTDKGLQNIDFFEAKQVNVSALTGPEKTSIEELSSQTPYKKELAGQKGIIFGAKYQTTPKGEKLFADLSDRITYEEAVKELRKFFTEKELPVNLAEQITTPNGHLAFGRYYDEMIEFVRNPLKNTPSHEAVHAYIDMFVTKEKKDEIIQEVMDRNSDIKSEIEAEERLADDFVDYAKRQKRQTFTEKIRMFFSNIWNRIKNFLGIAKPDKVRKLYDDIIAKKRLKTVKSEKAPPKYEESLSDGEIEAFDYIQAGKGVPERLNEAVEMLKAKGLIRSTYIPSPEVIKTAKIQKTPKIRPTVKPMQSGEKISERGIILRRLQSDVPRPYILSYITGVKRVVRTFEKVEDARWIYDAMVDIRKMGARKRGELPLELQPTNEQKQIIHNIVQSKKITPLQYKRLALAYTKVDSTLKMTPEQADYFIGMLKELKPKFGGKISIPTTTDLVVKEMAERKFKNVTFGWMIDIFKSPRNVFRNLGIAPETEPVFKGMQLRRDFVNHTFSKISEWQKELGVKRLNMFNKKRFEAESKKLFRAINNQEISGLTEQEALIVGKAKQLADEVADLVDDARAEIGLDPMNRRDKYITNLLTDEGHFLIQNTKQAPNELYAILDMRLPSKVFDRLLLERKGGLPIKEDFWAALKAMTKMHGKYIYLNPPVHRLERFMRFYGDKMPVLSRQYISGRIKRFLGRPTKIETYLRSLDEAITKFISRIPGLSRKYELEMQNGMTEVLNVPRFNLKIVQKIGPTLKSVRYIYDLAGSVSFYTINLTQFWINTVPKLRGNLLEVYQSAISGYGQMMLDFFRSSKWEYWRQRGVLTEIENVVDNEYRAKLGGNVLNIFAKLSEFNNRVASAIATEKNMALLAKHGKFEKLYKELANSFGPEAQEYARNLSDITQFRYGVEEKPVAFDNPMMDLYYQYNTFALKQAELVEGMMKNIEVKKSFDDFKKAWKEGRTKEFIADMTQGQRGEFIRFLINVFILSMILGGGYIVDAAFKGMVPNQAEGMKDILVGLWNGDKKLRQQGYKKVLTPPSWDLIEKVFDYGIKATIKNAKAVKQLNLIRSILTGEEAEIKTIEGKIVEKISPEVATKRLIASSKEKTALINSKSWDLYNKIDRNYSNTRNKALELLKKGRNEEAKNLVRLYNNWAKLRIKELDDFDPTDLRLKDILKKIKKSHIVDMANFNEWKKEAKK